VSTPARAPLSSSGWPRHHLDQNSFEIANRQFAKQPFSPGQAGPSPRRRKRPGKLDRLRANRPHRLGNRNTRQYGTGHKRSTPQYFSNHLQRVKCRTLSDQEILWYVFHSVDKAPRRAHRAAFQLEIAIDITACDYLEMSSAVGYLSLHPAGSWSVRCMGEERVGVSTARLRKTLCWLSQSYL
jgi:hypothetical protein